MDTFGLTSYSETAKNLLAKLRAKELTLTDFLKECAYWALKDGFDEIRPLSLPASPTTQAFSEYDNLPPERQNKVDPDFFRKNYEIIEYYQQVRFVQNRNKACLEWLKEISAYIPQEDVITLKKISDKILELEGWLNDNPVIVERIKTTFQARAVTPKRNIYRAGEVVEDTF